MGVRTGSICVHTYFLYTQTSCTYFLPQVTSYCVLPLHTDFLQIPPPSSYFLYICTSSIWFLHLPTVLPVDAYICHTISTSCNNISGEIVLPPPTPSTSVNVYYLNIRPLLASCNHALPLHTFTLLTSCTYLLFILCSLSLIPWRQPCTSSIVVVSALTYEGAPSM